MTSALLVPMHLDVLRLPRSTCVSGPLMSLEDLPWSSPEWGRDVNADTPFLASAIVARPLGGASRALEAGFHLHWILPDALRHGRLDRQTGQTSFPAVPNRWLVTRVLGGKIKQWIVESDYRWPSLAQWTDHAPPLPTYRKDLAVTLLAHDPTSDRQPFQHIGRAFFYDQWQETSSQCRMDGGGASGPGAGRLTAVGYGDVTFAAYHPHCHSVFGFCDSWEDHESVPLEIEYRVIGWYSDPNQDPLSLPGIEWQHETQPNGDPIWTLTSHQWKASAPQAPKRTLCFSSTRVRAKDGPSADTEPCIAAVGSTGTEAVSVFLAAQLSAVGGSSAEAAALRSKIEDQLEAVHVRTALAGHEIDRATRLRAARHERGFRPERGAPLWKHTVQTAGFELAGELASKLAEGIRALDVLEATRHQYVLDHAAAQQALFSDWCKYMSVAYRVPDDDPHQYVEIDLVKQYIELVHLKGDTSGSASVVAEKAAAITSATDEIARVLDDLNALIAAHSAPVKLERAPGPQFWRPTDPVVLMTGSAIRGRERQDRGDGPLQCRTHVLGADPWPSKADLKAMSIALAVPQPTGATPAPGLLESDGRPHNPLFLEWGVDLYSAQGHSRGRTSGSGEYDPNVILDNYDIPARAPDLEPRGGLEVAANPDRFDGRSFLSAHAAKTVLAGLCAYITDELLERYRPLEDERNTEDYREKLDAWYDRTKISQFLGVGGFDPQKRAALEEWYLSRPIGPNGAMILGSKSAAERFDDPMWTAVRAVSELVDAQGKLRDFLSASLEGFHDELLGFARTPVLPIDEPIGFAPYRELSRTVGRLTGQRVATPEPDNPYSPVRSGELEVSALRIIDSFGQMVDVPPVKVLGPARYTSEGRHGAIYFPPRVAQAMNVKFRWLDAERSAAELVEGGEVICGWLVPNPGSRSITVFSRTGVGLGLLTIDQDHGYVEWVPAPGQPAIARGTLDSRDRDVLQMDAAIENRHLRRVVEHLWMASPAYLAAFVDCLVDAQENIDPEASRQYSSLAMLMGRPLAVARAELDLYPLHDAVTRGDWLDFERRIRGKAQSDEGFTRVQFPIRLGEYAQLDDGLAGYWVENPGDSSFADRCFHAQAADDVAGLGTGQFDDGYRIRAHASASVANASPDRFAGETINIHQSIGSAPLWLTVLFDPRGVVHLTTGILPTKVISIPAARFSEALASIELWFKAGPFLERAGENDLPIPSDSAYDVLFRGAAWTKTEDGQDGDRVWDDLRATPSIPAALVHEGLETIEAATTIEALEAHRWLKAADPNGIRYHVLPRDERMPLGLGESREKALGDFVDQRSTQIGEPLVMAHLHGRAEAREGWVVFQRSSPPSLAQAIEDEPEMTPVP